MANKADGGSGSTTTKPKKPPKLPTFHPPVHTAPAKHYSTTPPISHGSAAANRTGSHTGSHTGSKSASSSSSAGGHKTTDPYAYAKAAEARANAKEKQAKHKAAQKYVEQAKNLDAQAKALKEALKKDFKQALDVKLANVGRVLADQQAVVLGGYEDRYGQLAGAAEDNEKAEASASEENAGNQVRERNAAVSQAMDQGAGESDVLATQIMSLRNWNANQSDANRSYFDTLRSVNSSLTDLNVDTHTALTNNSIQANADKEQLWTNYFNQRSEAYTNLGNVYGQQADYYADAKEMEAGSTTVKTGGHKKGGGGHKGGGKIVAQPAKGGGKATLQPLAAKAAGKHPAKPGGKPGGKGGGKGGGKAKVVDLGKQAKKNAADAYMDASHEAGRAWKNPGASDATMNWKGHDDFEAKANTLSKIQAAHTVKLGRRPEGATLRKWSA